MYCVSGVYFRGYLGGFRESLVLDGVFVLFLFLIFSCSMVRFLVAWDVFGFLRFWFGFCFRGRGVVISIEDRLGLGRCNI